MGFVHVLWLNVRGQPQISQTAGGCSPEILAVVWGCSILWLPRFVSSVVFLILQGDGGFGVCCFWSFGALGYFGHARCSSLEGFGGLVAVLLWLLIVCGFWGFGRRAGAELSRNNTFWKLLLGAGFPLKSQTTQRATFFFSMARIPGLPHAQCRLAILNLFICWTICFVCVASQAMQARHTGG